MKYDLVLCAITDIYEEDTLDEDALWNDSFLNINKIKKQIILPLINHPHNDVENGQKEIHYHTDSRYFGNQPHLNSFCVPKNDFKHRIILDEYPIKVFKLIKYNNFHHGITPVELIKNSKLKHKCIYKGKCPHRGMNLDNVKSKNGIITCPLHGLQFNANTKNLI